jgi:hypothetical protein
MSRFWWTCTIASTMLGGPHVPRTANVVVLDGAISLVEWQGAAQHDIAPGSTMRWQHDGRALTLALQGPPQFYSLCIVHGDTLRVLHASAALGTATYRKTDGEGRWTRVADFDFSTRGMTSDEHAARFGWAGSVQGSSGSFDREYRLPVSWIRPGVRMSLGSVGVMGGAHQWPPGASDDCQSQSLAFGRTPATVAVHPERWADVELH